MARAFRNKRTGEITVVDDNGNTIQQPISSAQTVINDGGYDLEYIYKTEGNWFSTSLLSFAFIAFCLLVSFAVKKTIVYIATGKPWIKC